MLKDVIYECLKFMIIISNQATWGHNTYFMTLFLFHISGEPVHLMSVTPTPYGAAQEGASFICLLTDPDKDQLNRIVTSRLVMRGSLSPFNTLDMPKGAYYETNSTMNTYTVLLANDIEAQGVFYCQASSTRVPVTILHHDSKLHLNHTFLIYDHI